MEHEPDDERPLLRSTRLPPATAATLRSSLDDRDTRAQELREALEDLRADLEGRSRQGAPSRSGRPAAHPTGAPAPPPTDAPAPPASGAPAPPPAEPPAPPASWDSAPPASGHSAVELPVPPSAPTSPSPSPAAASPATPSAGRDLSRSPGILGRRVALGALVALAMLVAVTGVVRVVAWSVTGGRSGPPPDAASSAHASPVPSARSSAPSSAHAAVPTNPRPSTPPTALPQAGPAIPLPAGLPVSGPGADVPGAEFTAVVQPGGSLVVYERLVVRPGTASVRLAPAPAQGLPAALRGDGSTVTDLRVAVDGRVVPPRTEDLGWRVALPGGGPFTQVVVRYRLAGALVRATPAPPGRATLVLRPLTGPQAAGAQDPVVVRLHDARVGQVYCPSSPEPLCDTASGAAHLATVPAGSSPIVLAQVTLP